MDERMLDIMREFNRHDMRDEIDNIDNIRVEENRDKHDKRGKGEKTKSPDVEVIVENTIMPEIQ